MRTKPLKLAGLAALAALQIGAASAAETSKAWLHVRVEEARKESKVSVNLPLSVVEVALRAAPDTVSSKGHVHLGVEGKHMKVEDLREMWRQLKTSGDMELVRVEEKDQNVKVARSGNLVLIHVEKPGKPDAVRVELPTEVVDALLSGEGEQLNLRAALTELQKRRGDIVRVNDEGSTVRIWIDEEK